MKRLLILQMLWLLMGGGQQQWQEQPVESDLAATFRIPL